MSDKFTDQVVAARAYLALQYPFYAFLLHRARIFPNDNIPTACVDVNGRISINPEFFDKQATPLKRAFVLAHEILHPAFGIFWRGVNHHPGLSNKAHDFVINLLLKHENPSWLLDGVLCDDRFEGMCYEEVYGILKSEMPVVDVPGHGKCRVNAGKSNKGSKGNDAILFDPIDGVVDIVDISGVGGDIDWTSGCERGGDGGAIIVNWGQACARAAEAARMVGKLPGHIQRMVGSLLAPTISWQDKLKLAVVEELNKTQVNWSMPHRRSESYNCYTPREDYIGFDVSICVDTSGSISEAELLRAVTEIDAIVKETAGEGRYVVGDAAVYADVALRDFKPDMLAGGGGTSFVPHFAHLEKYPTKLCIFFTDTFGEFPSKVPHFPVIWAVYKQAVRHGAEVPFGEIIEVDV